MQKDTDIRMIVLVPLGGLCNRLRAIMSAIELAQRWQVELRIVWLRDAGLNARFTDLFLPLSSLKESDAWYKYGVPRRRNLWLPSCWQQWHFDSCLTEAQLIEVLGQQITEEELSQVLRSKVHGKVLIQTGLGFFPTDDLLFLHFFQPSGQVRKLQEPRLEYITEHTVGVHIRRTDNVLATLHSPLSAFEAKMMADVKRDAATRFYVATDDASVITRLQSLFPGRIINSPLQTGNTYKSGFFHGRSSTEGMLEAVAELFTLIACPRFHGSYWSSFSDAVVGCHADGLADIIFVN